MAIDEYFLNLANKEEIEGVLRFYTWLPCSISIGKFLRTTVLNLQKIREDNIPVVRRITGGNAIFHKNDLSYSFVVKKGLFNITDKKALYLFLGEIFIEALNKIGIMAKINLTPSIYKNNPDCFSSISQYEITDATGNKIIASAQNIIKNAFLQHGSFYPNNNNNLTLYLLNNKSDKSNYFNENSFHSNKYDIFINEVKKILMKKTKLTIYKFTSQDKKEINLLVKQKYSTKKWNFNK